jgi:hypothetical protein
MARSMPGLSTEKKRALAKRLREIAADPKPAKEWEAIAADYLSHADELDPPPPPKHRKS